MATHKSKTIKKNKLRSKGLSKGKSRKNRSYLVGKNMRTKNLVPQESHDLSKQEKFSQALLRARKILNNMKIPFHLSSGTCLGYYRTGKFLDHDHDIDIGVFSKHYQPGIVKQFKRGGFKHIATFGDVDNGLEYGFRHKKTKVKLDIIFYYQEIDYFWSACYKPPYRLKDQVRYKHSPFVPVKVNFCGHEFYAPPITYIEEYYEPWRTPVKGKYRYWKTRNSCAPADLEDFQGYLINRSWQSKVTIGIKTFMRPENLQRCLKTIRKFYPLMPIMVADDSTPEIKAINKKLVKKYDAEYVDLDFDSGLSKGRNTMVKQATTKYYVTIDDDSIFIPQTDLKKFYKFLEKKSKYDGIGGKCQNRPSFTCQYSHFAREGKNKILYYWKKNRGPVNGGGCTAVRTDRMQNFFMARTERLGELLWDEELKLAEHNNFFVRAWQAKWRLAFTNEVILSEKRTQNGIYQIYRSRRDDFIPISHRKTGKSVKLDNYIAYQRNLKPSEINKKVVGFRQLEKQMKQKRKTVSDEQKKDKKEKNFSKKKAKKIKVAENKLLEKIQQKFNFESVDHKD